MNLANKRYLYLVRCSQAVKVGISNLPEQRIQLIKTDNHQPVEVLGIYQISEAQYIEAELHSLFKELGTHIRGEWFRLSAEQVEAVLNVIEETYQASAVQSLR